MGKRAIAIQSPKIRIWDIQQESFIYADDTGTANAYAVALSPAPIIVEGSVVVMKALHTNTGASTIAVNGGSATPIKIRHNVALTGGEILAGEISVLVYDGTNWQIISGVTWGTISDIQQQKYTYADDSGSSNTYAVTLSPAPTIVEGSVVVFKAANANTGASTLNVNSGGTVAIKKNGSTALASGDIHAGQIILVVSDGTFWQMIGGSGGTTITLQTNGVNNGSQTLLNQVAGANITITDDGSGDITFASSFSASSALALNFGIAALGQPPGGSAILGIYTVPTNCGMTFAINFAGSKGDCQANPTGAQSWTVNKNGSQVGTISISTGGVVTFASGSPPTTVTFAAGDILTIVGASSADATLSGVDIVLYATLTTQPANPLIIIPVCWLGQPGASQLMLIYTFTNACSFSSNWAGAKGSVQANPTSAWQAVIKKNGVQIGTISVSTGGVVTFASGSPPIIPTFVAGDELTIIAPSSIDATLSGFSATFETSTGGYVQLGGDIGNTTSSPVVIAINGYSVGLADDSGSANAYAVTTPYTFVLAKYAEVTFKAAHANTGASTLNVNGGGAVAIKKGGSTALASGDIAAGQIVSCFYDGTNWQMLSWSGSSGGGGGIQYGTRASLPGSIPASGTQYICTDSPYSYVSNGSAWLAFFMGIPVVEPVSGNFSWVNQSTANIDTSLGGERMYFNSSSTGFCRRVKSYPGVAFTQDFGFIFSGNNNGGSGLSIENASPTMLDWRCADNDSATQPAVGWDSWTGPNTASGGAQVQAPSTIKLMSSSIIWLRFKDDGSNRKLYWSANKIDWVLWRSESRTATVTPTKIGYCMNSSVGSNGTNSVWLIHDNQTQP